jgi:hypothetical protein
VVNVARATAWTASAAAARVSSQLLPATVMVACPENVVIRRTPRVGYAAILAA